MHGGLGFPAVEQNLEKGLFLEKVRENLERSGNFCRILPESGKDQEISFPLGDSLFFKIFFVGPNHWLFFPAWMFCCQNNIRPSRYIWLRSYIEDIVKFIKSAIPTGHFKIAISVQKKLLEDFYLFSSSFVNFSPRTSFINVLQCVMAMLFVFSLNLSNSWHVKIICGVFFPNCFI